MLANAYINKEPGSDRLITHMDLYRSPKNPSYNANSPQMTFRTLLTDKSSHTIMEADLKDWEFDHNNDEHYSTNPSNKKSQNHNSYTYHVPNEITQNDIDAIQSQLQNKKNFQTIFKNITGGSYIQ